MDDNPKPQDEKPVETPVETPIEDKVPEFKNEDLHKESFEEIAKNDKLPEEEPPKAPVTPEEPKKDEKPPEEVIETEKLAEDISKKVAEQLKPKEEEVPKDKYNEFFSKIKVEKGRDPNWIELSQFLEEQAVLRVEERQKQVIAEETKLKEEQNKATEAFTKRFNDQIDEELDELYKSGNLAPIKDKNNPNDQGVLERKALFQAMLDTNAKRTTEGKDTILSVARIFYGGYYTKPNAQPAGAEAPVSMGKGTPVSEGEEQEIDYLKDIKKPWSFFRPQPK